MTVSLSELEDFISDGDVTDSDFDAEHFGRVISDFVRSLSARRRFIFMSRYYAYEPIEKIANELSLSRSMINKELATIRSALRNLLRMEGYLI